MDRAKQHILVSGFSGVCGNHMADCGLRYAAQRFLTSVSVWQLRFSPQEYVKLGLRV
jgi:hypothetical protein